MVGRGGLMVWGVKKKVGKRGRIEGGSAGGGKGRRNDGDMRARAIGGGVQTGE